MVRPNFCNSTMETFSLLQTSLDQTIDRKLMEEASVAVRSVARADCAKLQRELFGIVVSRLEREEALAFQMELKRRNFPTELVADRDLPVLHESFQVQRVEVRGEVVILTDSMGREKPRHLSDLVFLAAGFFNRIEFKTEWHQHIDFSADDCRGIRLTNEREYKEETELNFRLDFFFWAEPNRLHATLGKETAIFHQGEVVRMKNRAALDKLVSAMGTLLPPERLNTVLRSPGIPRIYPNFQSYEEEIRWHFHRLKASA